MEKNQIELITNQTNNLDVNSEDKERYDFLFETSKAKTLECALT